MRDSAYPHDAETLVTMTTVSIATMKELRVASQISSSSKKSQLSSVNPPTGFNPSVRRVKVAKSSYA